MPILLSPYSTSSPLCQELFSVDTNAYMCYAVWMSKFKAKRVKLDGYTFDSKAESLYYLQLKEDPDVIQETLEVHPRYRIELNGVKVCDVILDFRFRKKGLTGDPSDVMVVDVKGRDTPVSRLKRKLVKAVHNVDVIIVPARSLYK